MTGIILTVGSAGLMCVAGVGLTSALKWFHNYEPNLNKSSGRGRESNEDDPNVERIREMRARARKSK